MPNPEKKERNQEIYELYKNKKYSYHKLSLLYGTTPQRIGQIINMLREREQEQKQGNK